jgi:hypothetical protein
MYDFHVGQKVVCVDAQPNPRALPTMDGLQEGQIYHIRWFGEMTHKTWGTFIGIRVQEIFRQPAWAGDTIDLPYNARRFRPLVEKKTDISIFKKMERPKTKQLEKV